MKVTFIERKGTWREVADKARTTIGLEHGTGEPSDEWKRKILRAEHSPIRALSYRFRVEDVPYWVAMHFVRHHIGIEHYIKTQRSDRTGVSRDELPQNAPVTWEFEANAQAMINISRKRLCYQAAEETRKVWIKVLSYLEEPDLCDLCVKECIYRGHCPEMKSCGFVKSEAFSRCLESYRSDN